MNPGVPIKKLSMMPFLANLQKGKQTKVTFESLPKPKLSPRLYYDSYGAQLEDHMNRFKIVPSLRPFTKSLHNLTPQEEDDDFKGTGKFNTHLDLPRDKDDYDLDFTPYQYDNGYGQRPQTSYLSVPFASRNRALESIAECRTPTASSSSSRGGDESPEYNQILDVKREKTFEKTPDQEHGILKSSSRYDSKVLTLPRIQHENVRVSPVKVKQVPSLRNNERLPSISTAFQRMESTETFLAHSRFMSNSRSDSVESIRTPSTSRHLLWSRGSIMSDGGFPKNRSDTSITRLSHQSEPTPTIQNDFPKSGKQRKKARKHRRKSATKYYVPYQSFLDSVIGNKTNPDKPKVKSFIKSANFTLYFPSIHKKCTITPLRKEGKWCSK